MMESPEHSGRAACGALIVPPSQVQHILAICDRLRLIALPYQHGGRGGREVCFTSSSDSKAARAIPLHAIAASALALGPPEDPELAALLASGEVRFEAQYHPPPARGRRSEAGQIAQSGDDSNCSSCPEAYIPGRVRCPGNFDFRFIELFAGIGGFRLGLEAVGGHCVFASEMDKGAASLYEEHFGEKPFGDITAVASHDIPEHDLLTAGFPCQPFSTLGEQPGFTDTKGTLFREIVRVLKALQPRACLLENVVGLLTCDGGAVYEAIVTELEGCGYTISHRVINSRTLTPQNRKRVYIVGIRQDLLLPPFSFPYIPDLGRRCGDILEGACANAANYTLSEAQWEKMRAAPTFRGWRSLAWADRPAAAIVSHYRRDLGNTQVVPRDPPHNPRFFTQRECARLQGFPESFPAEGFDFYHFIGNAVTAPVVAVLAGAILCHLEHEQQGGCNCPGLAEGLQTVCKASPAHLSDRLINFPDGSQESLGCIVSS